MLYLIFLLISINLYSQDIEIERYASFPEFEIDTSSEEGVCKLNFLLKADAVFIYADIIISEFPNTETRIVQITDLEVSEDLEFPHISFYYEYDKVYLVSLTKKGTLEDGNSVSSYGYRLISFQNSIQNPGETLILVDEFIAPQIKEELTLFSETLLKSGIKNEILETPRAENFNAKKVQHTKAIIEYYERTNPDLENIILIGRVPYPMSGHYSPDGHRDEGYGAWPTDLYYAVKSNNWTDAEIDTTNPIVFPEHKNIKTDGKFDQIYVPKEVYYNIGRIDMYDLPSFEKSEVELIKQYLKRDIAFRNSEYKPENNAIYDNGFEDVYQEKFPTEALINYHSLFGSGNYVNKKSRYIMDKEEYLFFWGAAPGGTNSIFDIVYTEEISKQQFNGVFNTLFGSRALEWTHEDNILRAVLASEPFALTSRWGLRPFYFTFPMGVGKTIGWCHTFSANNTGLNYNGSKVSQRAIHQNLLGDPTLKMYYPEKVSGFAVTSYNYNNVFSWNEVKNSAGYNIYYLDSNEYKLLNEEVIKDTVFRKKNIPYYSNFLIKSVERVENNSGYYYEESIGTEVKRATIDDVEIFPNPVSRFLNIKPAVPKVTIIDLKGNVVYEEEGIVNKIDLLELGINEGAYIIKINSSNFELIVKFVYVK